MSGRNRQQTEKLNDIILNCLERSTVLNAKEVALEVAKIAQESGIEPWADNTIRYHLDQLKRDRKIRIQKMGYFIDRGHKEEQPKAFIFVEVIQPKKKGKINQEELIVEVRNSFRRGECEGVNLIGIDEVMGAEFSIIIQVYSDHLHFIGRFVKEYLLTSELVTNTRTIMVWPREFGLSKSV